MKYPIPGTSTTVLEIAHLHELGVALAELDSAQPPRSILILNRSAFDAERLERDLLDAARAGLAFVSVQGDRSVALVQVCADASEAMNAGITELSLRSELATITYSHRHSLDQVLYFFRMLCDRVCAESSVVIVADSDPIRRRISRENIELYFEHDLERRVAATDSQIGLALIS